MRFFMDFVVPRHYLPVQRSATEMLSDFGPRYNGPGANFITVVVSSQAELARLYETLLVKYKASVRVLSRAIVSGADEEAILVELIPPENLGPPCFYCKGHGHRYDVCPERLKHVRSNDSFGKALASVVCTRCNGSGHYAVNCTAVMPRVCKACGLRNHTSASMMCVFWDNHITCSACGNNGHASAHCQGA